MNIGDKVEIKECHKMPQLIGKIAKVVAMVDPEMSKYPIMVEPDEPVEVETPMGTLKTKGPFGFREDELEPADPAKGIPKAFTEESEPEPEPA